MADACECGNEPSGSVKSAQEGLCTMEQVSKYSSKSATNVCRVTKMNKFKHQQGKNNLSNN